MRDRRELVIGIWGGLAFGAVLGAYMMFRPVRDAAVLGGKSESIKWLFLGTFVATALASTVWSAVLARAGRRRCVPAAIHGFAVCLLGFAGLVAAAVEPAVVGHVFYIFASVFSLFVVSVLWSLLADLLGYARAKRLYGMIAAGGSLGAIAGPALTRLTVDAIGLGGVLVSSAIALELGVLCITQVRRHVRALPGDDHHDDAPLPGGPFQGLGRVARSPYLLAIVGYVLCTAIAATFMYLEQLAIANAAYPDRVERTELFATIELLTNTGTFLVQTLLTARIVRWLGPTVLLFALPIAQAIGVSTVLLVPTIGVLIAAQVTTRVVTHAFTRPTRELLFTVVSADDKYRAKNAIDTAGYRFGDLASSWIYDAMKGAGAGTAGAIGASSVLLLGGLAPLALVWLALATALGIGFRRRESRISEAPPARVVER